MKELNAFNQLVVKESSFFLTETALADDIVEEFATFSVLHDHENGEICLDNVVKLNYVLVLDFLENLNLASDTRTVRHHRYLASLKDLDGYFFLGSHTDAKFDLAKCTFTQVSFEDVLSNLLELFR